MEDFETHKALREWSKTPSEFSGLESRLDRLFLAAQRIGSRALRKYGIPRSEKPIAPVINLEEERIKRENSRR